MRMDMKALTKVRELMLEQKPNLAIQRARNCARDKPQSAQQFHPEPKDSEIRATPMNFCTAFEISLAHVSVLPHKGNDQIPGPSSR